MAHLNKRCNGSAPAPIKATLNLITVHSQDHLMNAMVIQDLATDMIELYRRTA